MSWPDVWRPKIYVAVYTISSSVILTNHTIVRKLTHLRKVAWFLLLELFLIIGRNMGVPDDGNNNSKTQLVWSWHYHIWNLFEEERWYRKCIGENPSFNRTHTFSKWTHSGSTKAALKQLPTGEYSTAFSNDIIDTLCCFYFKWFSVYASKVCSLFIMKLKSLKVLHMFR